LAAQDQLRPVMSVIETLAFIIIVSNVNCWDRWAWILFSMYEDTCTAVARFLWVS